MSQGVAEHTGCHRVALAMVSVEEALRRYAPDHLRQLPTQIHRILHPDVEALAAHRRMHMRRVASQQDTPIAVGFGLPCHVGESGDRSRRVGAVVSPVHSKKRLAPIAQRWFAAGLQFLFSEHDAHCPAVLQLSDRIGAGSVLAETPRRLFCYLSLRDQPTLCRVPARELNASRFTDKAARSIAANKVFRPERSPVGERDVNRGISLREPNHFASPIDRRPKLTDPTSEYGLNLVLPQMEKVIMP